MKQQCFTRNGDVWECQDFKICLNEEIGKGAFGSVFACQSKNSNIKEKLCAKIVEVNSKEMLNIIQRELDILNVLQEENNENLVKTYYQGFQDNNSKLFIIMERCSATLKDLLDQRKQFSQQDIEDIIYQIIDGYQSLYKHNFIHRDLKPDNILVKEVNGKTIYKIADFGTAKRSEIKLQQTIIGTPVYQAPEFNIINYNDQELKERVEQMQKDNKIKNCLSQADVYSIAIIAYQLYFQKLPFEPDYQGILIFFKNLKAGFFEFPQNLNRQSQNIQVLLIQQAIQYYPDKRITFEQILSRKNFGFKNFMPNSSTSINFQGFKLQPPQNCNQFNNPIPQQQFPQQQQNFVQQQQSQMPQQFVQQQQNRPSFGQQPQNNFFQFGQQQQIQNQKQFPQQNQFKVQNQQLNQPQPRQQFQRNKSSEQFGYQELFPKQYFKQFPQQNINLDFQQQKNQFPQNPNQNLSPHRQIQNQIFPRRTDLVMSPNQTIFQKSVQDVSTYLEQQINQNEPYFTDEAKVKLKHFQQLFQNNDIQGITNRKNDLLKMIIFDEKKKYSVDYLKFQYNLLSIIKNSHSQINPFQPQQEADWKQRIIQLLKQ